MGEPQDLTNMRLPQSAPPVGSASRVVHWMRKRFSPPRPRDTAAEHSLGHLFGITRAAALRHTRGAALRHIRAAHPERAIA